MNSCLPARWAGLVPCVATAVLLSACGGGDRSTTAASTGSAAATERALSAGEGTPPLFELSLSSAVGGTLLPFTAGQPLPEGEVPAGTTLVADGVPEFQAVVTNRWPDGSAKFAILSGRADLGMGTWRSIGLRTAASPEAAAPLTTEDLKATGISASVAFGAFGTAGWSAGDWDTPTRTVVSGPQMSSWTYRKPIGSDEHLVAWLEVRAYKGGQVEVLPWIENGYLMQAGGTEKSASATFTLGDQTRFTQSLTLLNHQRAVLAGGTTLTHWLGADPQVTPRHATKHFMDSRLVPRYSGQTAVTSPLLAQLVGEYTPLMQGSFPTYMGHTGYDPSIGLLPMWDVAYLSSGGDPRAWRSTIINGYAAGRYGVHYRDKVTQQPLAFSSFPDLVMRAGSGVSGIGGSSKNQYTPTVSGAVPPTFTTSHHPSMGYMAYLVSGWHYFREQIQFVATANYLKQANFVRLGSKGILESSTGALTQRGAAWAIRSLSQAAIATPDDDPLSAEFKASIDANVDYYHGRYILKPANPLGLVQPYSSYTSVDPWVGPNWMDDFFTGSFAFMKGLKLHHETLQPKLDSFLAWKFRAIVGRLGGSGPDQFSYSYAGQYNLPFAPSLKSDWVNGTGPWYANWGEVARAMNLPTNGEPGLELNSGYRGDPTGYWGNLMPALAYAVDEGAEGAEAAWARVTSSPDYAVTFKKFNDVPVWSVYPRTKELKQSGGDAPTLISFDNLKPGEWLELPNTKIASVLSTETVPRGWPSMVVTGTSGGTVDTLNSRLLVWGGGNSNYWGNEMYALNLGTKSIERITNPSPYTAAGADVNCAAALPDGTPRSRSTGGSLAFIASKNTFFAVGGNVSYCANGSRPANGGVWLRDFAKNEWSLEHELAPVQYGYGVMAVYDDLLGRVLVKDMAKLQAYSPTTSAFTVLHPNMPVDYHVSAALDTTRRKLVLVGNGVQVITLGNTADTVPTMSTVTTVNAVTGLATSSTGTTSLDKLVFGKQSPGVAYDPVADRIVAWNGGSEVWALDMATLAWTQVAVNAGPTAAASAQGTHGRWGYVPQQNVFALINDINQNAWVFRLAVTEAEKPAAP